MVISSISLAFLSLKWKTPSSHIARHRFNSTKPPGGSNYDRPTTPHPKKTVNQRGASQKNKQTENPDYKTKMMHVLLTLDGKPIEQEYVVLRFKKKEHSNSINVLVWDGIFLGG